jgi:hypothetical protein
MTRRALLPLLSLAAVLVAACAPVTGPAPPPPEQPVSRYCAPSVPNSAAAYQAAFDALRRTYTEWAGADGAVPVRINATRTVWMFGDTYIGRVLANGLISPSDRLVNNSFVVQDGRCFSPLMGGVPLARTDFIADPAPGQWYWPAGAVTDGGALRVFLLRLAAAPGGFGFQALDMRVATFSIPTLTQQGAPVPVPGDPSKPFGSTAFSNPNDTFVYLYGAFSSGESNQLDAPEQRHYVARAPKGSVANGATWEYWDGVAWVTDINAAAPMSFTDTPNAMPGDYMLDGPAAQLQVTRAPAGAVDYAYLGTAKLLDGFSDDVSVFKAPAPNGPWTYMGRVADAAYARRATYSGATHLGLQGTAGPVVVFSTNDFLFDDIDLPPSIGEYGPRYVDPLPGSLP